MSTVKVDNIAGNQQPLVMVDGAVAYEPFIATANQQDFVITRFDIKSCIRAFVGTTEVAADWLNTTTVRLTAPVAVGLKVCIYKTAEPKFQDYQGNWKRLADIKASISYAAGQVLPDPTGNAGQVLQVNAAGTGTSYTGIVGNTVGDIVHTKRTLDATYLPCNKGIYNKADYPALAPMIDGFVDVDGFGPMIKSQFNQQGAYPFRIRFLNGAYYAIVSVSVSVNQAFRSTDLLNWTSVIIGSNYMSDIAYLGGTYYANDFSATGTTKGWKSTDGINFTAITTGFTTNQSSLGCFVVAFNGVFIASVLSISGTNYSIYTSTDALTWSAMASTSTASGLTNAIVVADRAIWWAPDYVYESTNGTTLTTSQATATTLLVYSNGVGLKMNGGTNIMVKDYSAGATTWTNVSTAADTVSVMAGNGGNFFLATQTGKAFITKNKGITLTRIPNVKVNATGSGLMCANPVDGTVAYFGANSYISKTTTFETWTEVTDGTPQVSAQPYSSVKFKDSYYMFNAGGDSYYKSTNCINWTYYYSSTTTAYVTFAYNVNDTRLIVVMSDKTAKVTTDGINWTALDAKLTSANATTAVNVIGYGQNVIIMAAGYGSYSTDGGVTWTASAVMNLNTGWYFYWDDQYLIRAPTSTASNFYRSYDNGQTWVPPSTTINITAAYMTKDREGMLTVWTSTVSQGFLIYNLNVDKMAIAQKFNQSAAGPQSMTFGGVLGEYLLYQLNYGNTPANGVTWYIINPKTLDIVGSFVSVMVTYQAMTFANDNKGFILNTSGKVFKLGVFNIDTQFMAPYIKSAYIKAKV